MKKTLLASALIAATLAPVAVQAQPSAADRREARQDHRDDRREWRQDQRQDRREWRQDNRADRREWRQDNRQDWQRWREANRNNYRRGNWNAPFRYRSFAIGGIVPRSYWGSRYYVDNWDYYRLPRPTSSSYRYVRHYDDLLLLNTRNGRVIQVYRGFYW